MGRSGSEKASLTHGRFAKLPVPRLDLPVVPDFVVHLFPSILQTKSVIKASRCIEVLVRTYALVSCFVKRLSSTLTDVIIHRICLERGKNGGDSGKRECRQNCSKSGWRSR
jgi:hypothetical protein